MSRRPPPSLFQMWGRETVKDMVLIVASIPVIVCLFYVLVLAVDGGHWGRLIGLLVGFSLLWWCLRWLLVRWVAAGAARRGTPPS